MSRLPPFVHLATTVMTFAVNAFIHALASAMLTAFIEEHKDELDAL